MKLSLICCHCSFSLAQAMRLLKVGKIFKTLPNDQLPNYIFFCI